MTTDVLELVVPTGDVEELAASIATADAPFVTSGPVPPEDLEPALRQVRTLRTSCGLGDDVTGLPLLAGRDEALLLAASRRRHEREGTWSPAVADYHALVGLTTVRASLHGLDSDAGRGTVRLVGTCRRGGTDGPEPAQDTVELRIAGEGGSGAVSVPARAVRRFESGAPRWVGFEAEVAADALPLGRSRITLVVRTPEGHRDVTQRLRASVGALLESRPHDVGSRRVQVVPLGGTDTTELVVREGAEASPRAWERSMRRHDLRSLVRRRPFAWLRWARWLTRPLAGRGPVWVVGERADTARDNGLHWFTHLRAERPDARVYYVIDRSSSQAELVAGLGNVVWHSSWRHRLLMLHAEVMACAYSIKHLLPRQWDTDEYSRHGAWRLGALRVYLKHGVQTDAIGVRRRLYGHHLYLTSTDGETAAIRAYSGYDDQVVQTGLPRYDALVARPASRTVLFMPKWRSYLVPRLFTGSSEKQVPLEGSTYQRFISDLLSSPRLQAVLEQHDYRLQFMPHYNMADRLDDIPGLAARVDVVPANAGDIQSRMLSCDLFVTDFSSVHFDIAYVGTPVVYTHFDADEYFGSHAHPSWFDHERDGFGPVVHDVDATIDALERYLADGCRREPEYTERARRAFTHQDRLNCERVSRAVDELLGRPQP